MKKLMFIVCAAFALLIAGCTGCANKAVDDADTAVTIKTDIFEAIVGKVVFTVNAQYPTYDFYEAHGILNINENGQATVDRSTFRAAFGCVIANSTVIATIENDTLKLEKIDSPWLEDFHMCPFVPLTLQGAVEELQKKLDIELNGQPVVLRHQLAPNIFEPQYLFGSWSNCHSIEAYSLKIDVPATGKLNEFVAKESGFEK